MLEFLDRQIDKILLTALVLASAYFVIKLVGWSVSSDTIEWAKSFTAIFVGALMREIAGPISALVRKNGNGGSDAVSEKK